jgi:hypothetical protein
MGKKHTANSGENVCNDHDKGIASLIHKELLKVIGKSSYPSVAAPLSCPHYISVTRLIGFYKQYSSGDTKKNEKKMQALFSIHIFFVQRQFQETSHCAINT